MLLSTSSCRISWASKTIFNMTFLEVVRKHWKTLAKSFRSRWKWDMVVTCLKPSWNHKTHFLSKPWWTAIASSNASFKVWKFLKISKCWTNPGDLTHSAWWLKDPWKALWCQKKTGMWNTLLHVSVTNHTTHNTPLPTQMPAWYADSSMKVSAQATALCGSPASFLLANAPRTCSVRNIGWRQYTVRD